MKSSISDVARQAGVSTATVSRTFSHPEQVSPKTRDKVIAAANQLNFSVSRSAGILKSGRSYRIALLVGRGTIEWFTANVIDGLNDVFREAGYDLAIYPIGGTDERATFFDELPVRNNADAVIVSSFGISEHEIQRLGTTHVPIIGINAASPEDFTATVGINDEDGITLAVRHLVTLGHRNIMFVCGAYDLSLQFSSYNRITGFTAACEAERGVTSSILQVPRSDRFFDRTVSELLSRADAPTALCFHQDSMAIPFFFRLQQCGITVPGDLSITGFDDSDFAEDVGLTTIRQRPRDMAICAARIALDLIEGRPVEQPHVTFPTQLMLRNSTAKPGGRFHRA